MFDETIARRVRPLAEAFRDAGLVRLTVREDEFELEFRRAGTAAAPSAGTPETEPVAAAPANGIVPEVLTSDVVGIVRFMRPPATEGQRLEGDRDLAFVETLGIRNPVRSRGRGTLAAVFVTDGQPVEYGQPLFAIER
jgi:acetyl-CoA carboxylase biotin carboxyl carrier protein